MGKIRRLLFAGVLFTGVQCVPVFQPESCQKISGSLAVLLDDAVDSDRPFEIVVTLSDSTGLLREFPMLTFPNAAVALGHLTKTQINALCRNRSVLSIDKTKTFFPKP